MTRDELTQAIVKKKIQTFDLIRGAFDMEPKIMGFKSHEEMAVKWMKEAAKEIEKMIQKWEKENPL